MSGIQTVTGEIGAEELGFVLVHEHVAAASAGIVGGWPELYGGFEALVERGADALRSARAAGVTTVVDCTTFDLGRSARLLEEVSVRAEVPIIAATGIWLDPPVTLRARSVDQLANRFLLDLTEGMEGTSIRAGVIKIASDERIEPFAALVLEAAARASNETGAPIITHTAALHRTGDAQADLLESFGVAPSRVAIGHSDDSNDIGYLSGIADRGYFIAMDRLPNGALSEYGGQTVADRIDMIATLVERGYAGQVMVGHDDPVWAGLLTDEDQRRHQEANPDLLAFVSKKVLPGLRERGVDESDIRRITVDNPRRWLTSS